jgi:hypothetical protein
MRKTEIHRVNLSFMNKEQEINSVSVVGVLLLEVSNQEYDSKYDAERPDHNVADCQEVVLTTQSIGS